MLSCKFETGDGEGGEEKHVGDTDTREECALLVYKEHPEANGATFPASGGRECYAEFGMTRSNGSGNWQTCKFEGYCVSLSARALTAFARSQRTRVLPLGTFSPSLAQSITNSLS